MASRGVFLTNAPKSSLDCPSANRTPGFFDLLTRQQDYLSYSARPLHLRCLGHPFSCAACQTFITPTLLDSDVSWLRVSCGSMWVFVIVYLCKEPHLAPISFVIKVTPSLSSVSPIVLGLILDRLQVWCHSTSLVMSWPL